MLLRTTLAGHRLVLQMGSWPAPFGITVMADGLASIMLAASAILTTAIVFYAMGTLDQRMRMNFFPLVMFQLMGVNGAFLTGDLFNLYVFYEVLLMASFALLALGGQISQINGGIRYVVLNLLASSVFLATAGVIYGTLGTLNMAHIAMRMPTAPVAIQIFIAGLLFVAYGSKAGIFPLFFWLPSSYHTPHPAVTALFAGLLTKVGVYTLFRLYPLIFPDLLREWQSFLFLIAGFTMVVGVLGSMAVYTLRRVLSFHIISQVGYMIMGLGLAGSGDPTLAALGLAGGILMMVHNIFVKSALLMASGAAELEVGSGSLLRVRLAGLSHRRPLLTILFFTAAMSLAGIPPSSGFIGKLALLQNAVTGKYLAIGAVSLLVSFLTLMSMVRLWQKAFWGPPTQPIHPHTPLSMPRQRFLTLAPITALVVLSIAIGLFAAPIYRGVAIAAQQAMDRDAYIQAIAPVDAITFTGGIHDQ